MANQEELQEILRKIELTKSRIEGLQAVRQSLLDTVQDLDTAEDTLEKIKRKEQGSSMLLPLRGGVFLKASLDETDEVLLSFDDVAVSSSVQEAVEDLESREEELKERLSDINDSLKDERESLEELQAEAQSLASQRGAGGGLTAG